MKKRNFLSLIAMSLLTFSLTGCKRVNHSIDWCARREVNNERDLNCLYSNITLPDRPLTLDDIISIALCRNLTLKVKEQEYAIQCEVASRERFRMLPGLKLNYENSGRTENTASFSESLVPGVPPAPLSISSEQNIMRWDANIVWNLVDFGLSFFRTRQEINKALMAQLEYQRLQQNLIVEISRQYWKATVAKRALYKSIDIIQKSLEQQSALQRQMEAKVISEIQGLRNENQLINIHSQLQAYEKEYHSSITELASMMGVPACDANFDIADIEETDLNIELCDVCQLEKFALLNRPELYSSDVEEEVRADEVRAAIVQMLPGIELFGGPYHDSNRFLLFNNWLAAGVRATWNLLDFPAYMQEKNVAYNRKILSRKNRLSLSIGIMAQVHIAYLIYYDNLEAYMLAKELEAVNKRMLLAAKNEQRQGKLHEADILKYEAEALFSEINAIRAYAEVQNALEQLNSAIGMPRYFRTDNIYTAPPNIPQENLESLPPIVETPWTYKIG